MLSREVMQIENQRYYMSNGVPVSRQIGNKQQGTDITHNNTVGQPNNLVQGIGNHISVSNASSVQSSGQTNSSVYNGFYSTSTFNSINNFEASLQWLTESRMPNNSLLTDKNLNCSSHTTPSHSCCVNRLTGVDNIGMCSPLSADSFRSNRDTVSYQTKPPALSVNMIDSVQNWFNLPPLPNQQYSSKFNEQNLNCAQINLPMIEQSDLKQNDICLQIPDSYFEQSLNNASTNNKQMNGNNMNDLNNSKMPDVNDISNNLKSHNIGGYQTNNMSRDSWKQPLQTAANYISSPTLFSSLNESPEHYLYSLPPPTTTSYCMLSENTNNITTSKLPVQQQNCGVQQTIGKQQNQSIISNNNSRSLQCIDQLNHQTASSNGNGNDKSVYDSMKLNAIDLNNVQSFNNLKNSSNINKKYNPLYSSVYVPDHTNNLRSNPISSLEQKLSDVSKDNNVIEINDETSSGSDESNIIVEESDETEEIDSVISIEEMKKTFMEEETVELRCLVCNVKSSTQTPATNFIHMNDSFPLTSASKTPVASKLIQILPVDLQHFLKLHNSFMCRRCLNLIETVEVLEVKLTSVKQTLSENFSKTVQYFLPATPILEIENGKAKIIDKEIIPCIDKSNELNSNFTEDVDRLRKPEKDCIERNRLIDEIEESEEEIYDKEQDDDDDDDDEEEEDPENSENSENFKDEDENCGEEGKQCNICTKILCSVKSYKKHMELHTKCFSFYCEYCGKGFNLKKTLDKHVKLHEENSRYQCEKCGKTYTQKHRLEDHLKKHLGEFKMNCNECGKGFFEKAMLEIHMRSHTKEQPCVCEICGSKFIKASNLNEHLQICKKIEIKCSLCTEVFYSKTHLKKHEIMSHGKKPSSECNICGKTFVNVKDLKPHMRSHSEEKPFECKICGKRYKSVGNLNHHAKIHDSSKILKCSLCGEGFSRKKMLEDHMNKHTGKRIYKCNECGKDFFQEQNLQNHMKLHSDFIKKKECQICGKKFRLGLEVHMRTHTGIKPYVCSHCGQAFTVNRALTRHIQSKHQNVLEA